MSTKCYIMKFSKKMAFYRQLFLRLFIRKGGMGENQKFQRKDKKFKCQLTFGVIIFSVN